MTDDPIPFVKLVQKMLVGNYEPIMQARSQVFSKGGAEVMEAKALTRKNCL